MKRDIKFILLLDGSPLAKLVSAIAFGDFAGDITDKFFAGFNLIALVESGGATRRKNMQMYPFAMEYISWREGKLSLNHILKRNIR